jgi:DNA polymerase I-like protein with 3'-5' exonuclease and polymerase domains
MQNQPRAGDSKVKEHFISRFEDGVLIDIDFKQLEIVIFAYLTQDSALLRDLNNKVDIYTVAASEIYGVLEVDVTSDQRQLVKRAILAITYGAGINKISKTLNIDYELAHEIINVFYNKYPMTKLWQDNLVRQVEATRRFINEHTIKGEQKEIGYYQSFTGRIYKFFTGDAPDFLLRKGIKTGFNPPDIKNYPVQGTATADIVMLFLGMLWRKSLNNRDKYLLINTVHDSVVIDCKKEFVNYTCNLIKNEVNLIKVCLKQMYNIDFNVPLYVDIKIGTNWGSVR